jgi:hypothetical protein
MAEHEGLERAGGQVEGLCRLNLARRVGAMTKAVRNSARLTMTPFGGAVCVPMAERRSESTTTIRVKDVTITRMEGASARTVTSATS